MQLQLGSDITSVWTQDVNTKWVISDLPHDFIQNFMMIILIIIYQDTLQLPTNSAITDA